jgi:UDP-glucuronate 4-epimerase
MQTILVTGAAGFIGYHTISRLLKDNFHIIGIDNINDYYDVNLKYGRLNELGINRNEITENGKVISHKYNNFIFYKTDLVDREMIFNIFAEYKFDAVIHLAAQAGVRYSLTNPHAYISSNIEGFLNILEACRAFPPKHLIYASSSSVYGSNTQMPFRETDNVDHPVSLYAASKKSNELMAHTYSHLFNIPTTGLRFFTVYGPWGRPDMAIFLFTKAIDEGKPIDVFNNGELMRDFTYVDDIVEGIVRLIDNPAMPANEMTDSALTPDISKAPYRIYNIGNSKPVKLMDFITAIETALGKKAIIKMQPMQPGDVVNTWASTEKLEIKINYHPQAMISEGVFSFVNWFKSYYP